MEVQAKFKIIYSDEIIHFLNTLEIKARSKILYNINKCKYIVDKSLFKKLANTDIWEFRTLFNGVQYRLLACYHYAWFHKKNKKTPANEIKRAEEIRRKYFDTKR